MTWSIHHGEYVFFHFLRQHVPGVSVNDVARILPWFLAVQYGLLGTASVTLVVDSDRMPTCRSWLERDRSEKITERFEVVQVTGTA